jgi:arylformamidase
MMVKDEAGWPVAQLNSDYSARNTVSVAEFERVTALYRSLSEPARALPGARLGLEFDPATGMQLDLYGTEAGALRPCVVFIHGGYWRSLGRADSAFMASMLAAQGIATAVPDYRLAPKASMGEIVQDCRMALAYLWQNAEALGIDPARIVVTGSSAGGHLAAALAQGGWQAGFGLPDQVLAGCLPVSGLFDLAPLAACQVQDWMQFTPEEIEAHSPLRHLPKGCAGVVALAKPEAAGFERQSAAYAAATGWPLLEISGRHHFDVILDLAEPDTAVSRALLALVAGTIAA